jgi:hypothetical protein
MTVELLSALRLWTHQPAVPALRTEYSSDSVVQIPDFSTPGMSIIPPCRGEIHHVVGRCWIRFAETRLPPPKPLQTVQA